MSRLALIVTLLLTGPAVHRMFGAEEVLALAKGLTGLPGARLMRGRREVDYIALSVQKRNKNAHALYQSLGFVDLDKEHEVERFMRLDWSPEDS